jgi:hypothetical protein
VLGEPWTVELDCRAFSAGLALLTTRFLPNAGTLSPYGEILIEGPLLQQTLIPVAGVASRLTLDIPFDPRPMRIELHVQGLCQRTSVHPPKLMLYRAQLSIALDVVLGF